jgi:hypothetical protein
MIVDFNLVNLVNLVVVKRVIRKMAQAPATGSRSVVYTEGVGVKELDLYFLPSIVMGYT